jgi:hypothetical protein
MSTLLARLATAAGLAALIAFPAFAQNTSTALNGQLQWGDVISTVDVVSRNGAQTVSSVATSTGNAVSGVEPFGRPGSSIRADHVGRDLRDRHR